MLIKHSFNRFPSKVTMFVTKRLVIALCCVLVLLVCCFRSQVMAQTQDVTLVGAGDIARCGPEKLVNAQATATLLDSIPGQVFALGDVTYSNGRESEYFQCYDVTWGRHRARTIPVLGSHDIIVPSSYGYFNYFGPVAGDQSKGYYSFNYGAWHIIVLNSQCSGFIPCSSTSPQAQWLKADLTANPPTKSCTLALWHVPLYSSTSSSATTSVQPLWQILFNAGADLIVNGGAHNYERFAPQDPNGILNTTNGIVEIVVGTGGESHASFDTTTAANSIVRNSTTYGVLQLTLHATSYSWQFVPVAGQTFTDSGTQTCHL